MLHALEQSLLELWPRERWQDTRSLIAVSGGADSVALLCALSSLALQPELIEVAHFNHAWRGAESDRDEQFVQHLCGALGLQLHRGRAEIEASQRSEAAARHLRYQYMIRTAYQCGARYVLTAHTATDRVETLLHNLLRGTGLAGAAGPALCRGLDRELVLVRPLLSCSRGLVLDYLRHRGQDFREDSSNSDQGFKRNFLRHAVLPLIRQHYGPEVDAKLLQFSELAAETQSLLDALAIEYLSKSAALRDRLPGDATLVMEEAGFALPSHSLLPQPWPVVRECVRRAWSDRGWPLGEMGKSHWNAIRELFELPPTSLRAHQLNLPGNLFAKRWAEWVTFFQA